MKIRLHKNARATPAIRRELRASTLPVKALARDYGLNRATVRKWKARESQEDASHRPHTLHTTLNAGQEFPSASSGQASRWNCAVPCGCRWMTCSR